MAIDWRANHRMRRILLKTILVADTVFLSNILRYVGFNIDLNTAILNTPVTVSWILVIFTGLSAIYVLRDME